MAQPRLVFLTGATGFIGSRLARRLAARGDRLRCLVRPSSDTEELAWLGAELVTGELDDPEAWARGLEGADLAYHLAAVYDIGVVDERAMERANVGGTRAFIEAVERAGTPKAVYVSTTVALGPAPAGAERGGEDAQWRGPYPTAYHRTKAQAHGIALEAQRRGAPLVVVCPANVYGPGDRGPNGRFVADLVAGRVPGLLRDPAWFSYVHVDDVVEGLVRAGTTGRPGVTYVLSGEERSVDDFAAEVARLAGRRPPMLRFPVPMARATGAVLDRITRLTGICFPITRETVDAASGGRWLHPHERATHEFGWRPRPLAEGLGEMVAWVAAEESLQLTE